MAERATVLVSIGNSDDKLTQEQWSRYWAAVDHAIRSRSEMVYGAWVSDSVQPWQNASWAFSLTHYAMDPGQSYRDLRARLVAIADEYGQDSIAWLQGLTEFLRPEPVNAPPNTTGPPPAVSH